ncbi:hypothetical protein [Longimicrobium sp.]|uniref:hypothetical protein n=1 Tax=Longimicrobium sp. TaxID=2029185 RepID=UPI002E3540D2|nr:hypothetical protein [Longimicrobium sp.]HEX6038449.1 hypothetical protein [Longimicrobium sp.]
MMLILSGCSTGLRQKGPEPNQFASLDEALAALPPGSLPPIYILDGTMYLQREQLPPLREVRSVEVVPRYCCMASVVVDGRCPPVIQIRTSRQPKYP